MRGRWDFDSCLMGVFYACCPILLFCLTYLIAR